MQENQLPLKEIKEILVTIDYGLRTISKDRSQELGDKRNQDAVRIIPECNCAVICDGVGGDPNGADSANIAADTLRENIISGAKHGRASNIGVLTEAMQAAHTALKYETKMQEKISFSSTAVACRITHDEQGKLFAYIAQVGDCRAYKFTKNGKLIPITLDDTSRIREKPNRVAQYDFQDKVRNFAGTRLDAINANDRNISWYFGGGPLGGHTVDQTLGSGKVSADRRSSKPLQPDAYTVDIEPGDKIILTSDGLGNLTDKQIANILNDYRTANSNELANILATKASEVSKKDVSEDNPQQLARAKQDDISVVVMGVQGDNRRAGQIEKGAGGTIRPQGKEHRSSPIGGLKIIDQLRNLLSGKKPSRTEGKQRVPAPEQLVQASPLYDASNRSELYAVIKALGFIRSSSGKDPHPAQKVIDLIDAFLDNKSRTVGSEQIPIVIEQIPGDLQQKVYEMKRLENITTLDEFFKLLDKRKGILIGPGQVLKAEILKSLIGQYTLSEIGLDRFPKSIQRKVAELVILKDVHDFGTLYQKLKYLGGIQGANDFFNYDELQERIENFRETGSPSDSDKLPRIIRSLVVNLYNQEPRVNRR